jgi:EAL domain-containing protein (putative c-di-GMP-specific phosphodiesterase class I)
MGIARRANTQDLLPHVEATVGVTDLAVAFQPIVSVETGKLFAYEALLRSTDVHFPGPPALIERTISEDLCGELGRVVREMAVDRCRDATLFLNVHPREFEDRWMVRPDDPIFRHEHPVYLEITESVPMSHAFECKSTLREIRDKGIRLAVDDLGAGFSNLLYISQLSPEIVKLDRDLTAATVDDSRAAKLVRKVVELCEAMGARVVAEGVECRAELDGALAAGVHYVQGFFIGKPELEPVPITQTPW